MLFNENEIFDLAEEYFLLVCNDYPKYGGSHKQPGFLELIRIAKNKTPKNSDWLIDEITKAFSVSLRFANNLYYWWGKALFQSSTDYSKLRIKVVERAKQLYEKNPSLLISSLDEKYIFSLHHFIILFSETKYGGKGFKAKEWKWIAKTLLTAIKKNCKIIAPQLLCLLYERSNPMIRDESSYTFTLKEELADALFTDKHQILNCIVNCKMDIEKYSDEENHWIQTCQEKSKVWLSENP